MGASLVDYRVPSWQRRHRLLLRERRRITYANFIDRMAEVYGERTAFVLDEPIDYAGIGGTVLSYNDIARLVSRMAHGLQSLGVKCGDRSVLTSSTTWSGVPGSSSSCAIASSTAVLSDSPPEFRA
jgi:acyl-CoA synthetase (AMP-forming)/AMP-acid ligase II